MAQDFGDDMGNALLNFVTRQVENYLRFGRGTRFRLVAAPL